MSRIYYAYARHALVTALGMAGVNGGDSVLLPSFICRDVLASLKCLDAIPVFYNVDENLQVVDCGKLPPAAALLAVNYFGFPADINGIRQHLTDAKTVIIEDNAHGWLSVDQFGVPLGTRTSIGITSFRKTIRSLDGAMLEWNDSDPLEFSALHPPLTARTESLPASYWVRQLASAIDRHTSLPLLRISRNTLRATRSILGRPPIDQHLEEEFKLPITRAIHTSSLTKMSRINPEMERHRRQQAFQRCYELATSSELKFPRLNLTPGTSPQGFPFFIHHGDVGSFRSMVNKRKLGEIVKWPSLPSQSSIPIDSPLRELHLVNFLQ